MDFVATILLHITMWTTFTSAFNIDTGFPILLNGTKDSYFGYSVAFHKNARGNMLLVGAPRANSSYDTSSYQPGAIYRCPLGFSPCEEIRFDNRDVEPQHPDTYFQEYRKNSWLGVSLDTSNDGQSNVLACGHRWKDRQYSELYPINGICYTINADLNVNSAKALRPLVHRRKQLIEKIYFYALGMAGISAQYLSDGSGLMMGAPGVYDFTGTIVTQLKRDTEEFASRVVQRTRYRIPYPDTNIREMNSYFGYSVASGKFFKDGLLTYVAGAPRDGLVGRVYLFRLSKELDGTVEDRQILSSAEMGDYFGATLCAVDLNNDKLDDLLVGSPFFSVDGDEGAVTIFLSNGNVLDEVSGRKLTGSTTREARFGSSIAPIGDLNQDGFTDIVIGAPYEGNGAVYIYLGSPRGTQSKYSQRILASTLSSSLRGFGISLSRGRDIDANNYPDLAVGAYDSSQAVVLRTYPIVKVVGNIHFDVKNVQAAAKLCELNGAQVTCFQVETCVRFNGTDVSDELDMEISLDADVLKKSAEHSGRVYFNVNGANWGMYNYTNTLRRGELACRFHKAYIYNTVIDFLTPILFRLAYVVRKPTVTADFCKKCPVVDPTVSRAVEKEILFATNCGEDEVCQSDLELTAKMENVNPNVAMVIGSRENVNIRFEVRNRGDPAFQSTLHVTYPPEIDLNRNPAECFEHSEVSNLIICNMGNPLNDDVIGVMDLEFYLGRIPNSLRSLRINASVVTASQESPDKLHDNEVVIDLPLKAVADIHVQGLSIPDQVLYNKSFTVPQKLSHIYEVVNAEQTQVDSITISVLFPTATANKLLFINEISSKALFGRKEVLCSSYEVKPINPNLERYDNQDYGKVAVVDCSSMTCQRYTCVLGPFEKGVVATLNITAVIDIFSLRNITGEGNFEIKSAIKIVINDEVENLQPENSKPDSAMVATTIFPIGVTPQAKGIPIWIIIVAIIVGLVLLAVIIVLLFKFGFFARSQKEEMEKMLYSGELNTEGDNRLLSEDSESP